VKKLLNRVPALAIPTENGGRTGLHQAAIAVHAEVAKLLVVRKGPEAVTMRRVAKAVGITPMALYRHVADRDDLLNSLADAGFQELDLAASKDLSVKPKLKAKW
jgi:Bacterial regulatory proteins, tetR family